MTICLATSLECKQRKKIKGKGYLPSHLVAALELLLEKNLGKEVVAKIEQQADSLLLSVPRG